MLIQAMLLVAAGVIGAAPPGISAAGAQANDLAAGPPCVKLDVQAAGEKVARPDRFFSATSVRDITFVVSFPPRLAGAPVELAVYTPNGHLYQRLRVPSDAAGRGRRQATARLPVSGTLIVNSSLYGEWRVEPHVAGSPTSCGRPERFTITP